MRTRKRPLLLLFVGILSFIGLGSLIYFVSPDVTLSVPQTWANLPTVFVSFVHIPILIAFFSLLALFLFSVTTYIFKSKKHGILLAIFVTTYLLFRLNHLTHPFFLILLLALFFTLEMLLSGKETSYE